MILYPPPSNTAFYIFNYPIKFYGIIMSCAILTGIASSYYFYKKYNKNCNSEHFFDSFFPTIIFSLIGARLFYILGNFSFYEHNLDEIIKINHGGISIWGAILFGIFALYLFCKSKKENFMKYLDYYSLVMPLCQAIGRWGNYFNEEAYGKPANLFIKLYVNPQNRIYGYENYNYFTPSFLYESILDIILFIILLISFKKNQKKQGLTFLYYIFFYSMIRIIVEYTRIDSILNIKNIPIAIIISITALIISSILIIKITRKNKV